MSRRFEGQVVFVTGAASGIGRATAIRFGKEGAAVCCVDFNAEGNAATVKTIRDAGGEATAIPCDVRDARQCKDAVAKAVATYKKLTILCNIAGIWSSRHSQDET